MAEVGDHLREQMVEVMASELDISESRASEVMHRMWEATKDVKSGTGFTYDPDTSDPGIALARRVELAMIREFDGEEHFPAVVTVQDPRSGHIGVACLAVPPGEAEMLLRLGMGAIRRQLRQEGKSP